MCDCRKDLEARLKDRFIDQAPEATGHTVTLTGYAFVFGSGAVMKGVMPVEMEATYPLKKGGTKSKTTKTSMLFTFCPFCGEKYDKPEPVDAAHA